jgi:hypothetical protein
MLLSMMAKICIGRNEILEHRRQRILRFSQKTSNRVILLPSTSIVVVAVVVVAIL